VIILQSVNFKAGNRLLFNFHSDGSNNEWGYKFKVRANFIDLFCYLIFATLNSAEIVAIVTERRILPLPRTTVFN